MLGEMSSIIIMRHSLLKTLPLHCYRRCFEKHPSRNADWLSERWVESEWFISRHALLHGLRKEQQPQSGHQRSAHHQLLSIHSAVSLRHCSKFRQRSQKTLHRGSRRVRRRSVWKYDRILTTITLHITRWLGLSESCCKFLLARMRSFFIFSFFCWRIVMVVLFIA